MPLRRPMLKWTLTIATALLALACGPFAVSRASGKVFFMVGGAWLSYHHTGPLPANTILITDEWSAGAVVLNNPATLQAWLPLKWSRSSGFGTTITASLWPLLVVAAGLTLWAWRRDRRKPGACTRCGYDLTGNTSGRCPECGMAVPARAAQAAGHAVSRP